MTEQEWLICTDPQEMLGALAGKASDRKLRLCAVACCRPFLGPSAHSYLVRYLETAERFAEGQANRDELQKANEQAAAVCNATIRLSTQTAEIGQAVVAATSTDAISAVRLTLHHLRRAFQPNHEYIELLPLQCELIRDLFGNPFRPSHPLPELPANVIALAQAVYDGQDNRLILADALEETALTEPASHFRKGWHPKGCAVLDLILGK